MTLIRAVGDLSRNDLATRPSGHAGPPVATPAAQCLGVQPLRTGVRAARAGAARRRADGVRARAEHPAARHDRAPLDGHRTAHSLVPPHRPTRRRCRAERAEAGGGSLRARSSVCSTRETRRRMSSSKPTRRSWRHSRSIFWKNGSNRSRSRTARSRSGSDRSRFGRSKSRSGERLPVDHRGREIHLLLFQPCGPVEHDGERRHRGRAGRDHRQESLRVRRQVADAGA